MNARGKQEERGACNFVVPASDARTGELAGWKMFNDGRYCWSGLSYVQLCKATSSVQLSERACADCVNIAHVRLWTEQRSVPNVFVVACEADWPRLPWAHIHVVQNRLQVRGHNTFWMPLWPQMGLVARNPERAGVRKVGYLGRVDRPDELCKIEDAFRANGLDFVVKGEDSWNDFSDMDVSISLRFLEPYRIRRKPPTKLINAWLAEVPFVAMDEPAYRQIARNGDDYIGVKNPEEVVRAVLRLRADPSLYEKLVENGKAKAKEYGWEATTRRWIELLEGPVRERFELWKSRPVYEVVRSRLLFGYWRCVQTAIEAARLNFLRIKQTRNDGT
jgi:hypothetical protein